MKVTTLELRDLKVGQKFILKTSDKVMTRLVGVCEREYHILATCPFDDCNEWELPHHYQVTVID
jgi:hypothetical protein